MSILPQPLHPTGNVLIEEEPVLEPDTRRTIITLHCAIGGCGAVHANQAARTFADLRSDSLGAGWYPGDVCPDPAHEVLRACFAVLAPGPVPVPEEEETALARPYITVATVPASEQTPAAAATVSAVANPPAESPEDAAQAARALAEHLGPDEPGFGQDAPEQPAPDATAVMPKAEAHTEFVPVIVTDGGESDD